MISIDRHLHILAVVLWLALAGGAGVASAAPNARSKDNFSTDLTSLNYYPHQGQLELNTHATTTLHDQTTSSDGAQSHLAANQFYASLNYGMARRVRLALQETLLWDQLNDSVSAKQVESLTPSSGPSNPTFVAAWRFWEDARSGFSGDLTLELVPSFGAKVTGDGSLSRTGNNLTGGWQEQVSSAIFWRHGGNQLELNVAVVNNSPSVDETGSGGENRTTAYVSSSTTLTDRVHLSARHFIQASLEWYWATRRSSKAVSGVATTTEAPTSFSSALEYGYQTDPHLVLALNVTSHPSTSVATTSTATTTTAETREVTASVILLHEFE